MVTPCVGVWIETLWRDRKALEWGHTLRGCVDWNYTNYTSRDIITVTPCVGVWIETNLDMDGNPICLVTPCVGVWIETLKHSDCTICESHTLRGCVDWNFAVEDGNVGVLTSHPAWVCGLKPNGNTKTSCCNWSHPAWVCGLKRWRWRNLLKAKRHTLRGCVDWNIINKYYLYCLRVTPCVGVWIETLRWYLPGTSHLSHPAWVCGLKHRMCTPTQIWKVTPCVGVWIETTVSPLFGYLTPVTPCVGVWIETKIILSYRLSSPTSHPAWVCGLKPITRVLWKYSMSHTLRGCVDWNIRTMTAMYPYVVTPCVGVWIETTRSANFSFKSPCHTLRGCVDWNLLNSEQKIVAAVTPCVGVWIETGKLAPDTLWTLSHPAWVCGLKQWRGEYVYRQP